MNRPNYILPLIVVSQFAGTSLWFVGNAILPELQQQIGIGSKAIGNITSIVQFGFISGTLVFAIISIADRVSPSKLFFISSLLAALSNMCITWFANDSFSLLAFRFMTGFFLAGIYPIGMKIAADWYEKGLGKALSWLVGALVAGTAFPYLLKSSGYDLPAEKVILFTSLFAMAGGLLILLFVKDGPFRRRGQVFQPGQLIKIFKAKDFRSAAFGYFGHMWEVYTFWAFVPVLLALNPSLANSINIPFWSFLIIGIGAIGCVCGGFLSTRYGSAKIAFVSLLISGICCIVSFLMFNTAIVVSLIFFLIWGFTVVSDSPQFSALVAQTAPPELKGTALTFVTCIGFAITIASIEFLNFLVHQFPNEKEWLFTILAIGPVAGLFFLKKLPAKGWQL